MKEHPEVIRMHPATAPFWARLRRVIEKTNPTPHNTLKDIQILDRAVHAALTVLDPVNAAENSITIPLDYPVYIIPKDGEPEQQRVPTLTETIMARLDELEATVKTFMENNE